MYAVIRAGGKQFKVAKGDVIEIEKLSGADGSVDFQPLIVVDDKGKTTAGRSALSKAKVTAKVVGEAKGPKVEVSTYRNKTGYRRNNGHRQHYTSVEISEIKI